MNQKWNILHTEASDGWGGQEIRIFTEVQGMIRRGHRATIAAPADSAIFRKAVSAGIPTVEADFNRKAFLSGVFSVLGLIDRRGFDVVCTHSSRDSWVAGLAGRLSRRRPLVIRTRHLYIPVGKAFLSRWLYRRIPHLIVTTGEAVRTLVREGLRFPEGRTLSIPTGIDLNRFDPSLRHPSVRQEYGIPQDGFVVGTVAVLRSWKGHAYLLEAARELCADRPDIWFLVVGEGPLRDRYTRWVRERGLERRVILTGHQDRIPEILHSIDVFALPSYAHEGVPQGVIQAMAMKKAVITCDVGSVAEVIQEGVTGRLVPVKDYHALAAVIRELQEDNDQRSRLAAAAFSAARERMGIDAMLDRVEEAYSRGLCLLR